MAEIFSLPDGSLLVPTRAEGPDGLMGDGLQPVRKGTREWSSWMTWLARNDEKATPAPPELVKQFT